MASRARRTGGNGLEAWPGYVDALSTLSMVIIFVLLVFVLAQAFLGAALSGQSKELDKAKHQLSELANELSLARGRSRALQLSVSQLASELAASAASRNELAGQLSAARLDIETAIAANTKLQSQLSTATTQASTTQTQLAAAKSQLAEMQKQIADLNKTVTVDRKTLQAKLADLATLANQSRALAALRDQLEKQAQNAAAQAMTEKQRREAVALQLQKEQLLGGSARAEIALLNQQIDQLRDQLTAIAATLDLSMKENLAKDAQIKDLGQKLNIALAAKVQELKQYRSEFFGKLRKLLAGRPGIQIVGDRFVFQSEVLFPLGSADLTDAGKAEMTALAVTIKDIAAEIPPNIHWILRVDGHTDPLPVHNGAFASNWDLSAARAITVVRLLIKDGVPANHLAAAAFSSYQPFQKGHTPADYAKDRRIELRLTDR